MAETLTMMAVHAHPDDEASSTGGVLAAYSAQGIRTVVVTCTNGEFGDAPGGVKPGQNGHDEQAVAQQRLAELRESCTILGVTNLELLGYHDSGMPDWDYKDRPDAFCNIPEADVAARISALIDRYRPQVLITYDDHGPVPAPRPRAREPFGRSRVRGQRQRGQALPHRDARQRLAEDLGRRCANSAPTCPTAEEPDPETAAAVARLGAAHHHHRRHPVRAPPQARGPVRARQPDRQESWFSKIPQDIAEAAFGRESFIRASDTTGAPAPRGRPVRGTAAMTAGSYADAAGLVERSAAAFASAMPERRRTTASSGPPASPGG